MSELRLETSIDRLDRAFDGYNFALQAHADMLQMGLADPAMGWLVTSDSAVVLAKVGTEFVGVIVFDPTDPACATVSLAYVLSDYRRRGIFRHMLDELVKWCERNGRFRIEFDVPLQNAGAGRALVAIGGRAVSQRYRVDVT